jgi:hypothetical protein
VGRLYATVGQCRVGYASQAYLALCGPWQAERALCAWAEFGFTP